MNSQTVTTRERLSLRNALPKILVFDLRVKRCPAIRKMPSKVFSPSRFLNV
jgi:hypothetical protein